MPKRLAILMVLVCGSTAAWAGANEDCEKKSGDVAIAACTEAIRSNPRDAVAYNNRGVEYKTKGDYDRAIADYNKAIELNPKYANAYNNRGNAYAATGEYDRAIADYNKSMGFNPKDVFIDYTNRGEAYSAKGDNERAIADYTKAIGLNPKYANAYKNRGLTRYGTGDFRGAAADLLRAVQLEDNIYAMLFRYLARTRAGDTAAAELEANTGRLKTKEWPYAVAELYLGKRSPAATLDAAIKPDDRCRVQFYVGQWQCAPKARNTCGGGFHPDNCR